MEWYKFGVSLLIGAIMGALMGLAGFSWYTTVIVCGVVGLLISFI